ncbi:hypothetical protein COU91_02735 [Candidatus Saccharibacteria bacterium CG10_big_fil_rev_8_21_14_0_10_47_8]|nr:MAG: hypothetical protein COU91_02735 [Candidatus Saccharibacteria bacterium CG10_big_fil_rev_8_21_14_0_10_47_8]
MTLDHIAKKYDLDLDAKPPIVLNGTRDKDLAGLFAELGFIKGAEIGVEQGVYAKTLCQANPKMTLYCIDPWKAYPDYREHISQPKLDGFFKETKARLVPYKHKIIRDFSDNACKQFKDESLDFVYIDGNHEFFYVANDIVKWMPKVRKGGIIAGHDFRRNSGRYTNDVKDVISSYTNAKRIKPWFILDERPAASSWFWVKL